MGIYNTMDQISPGSKVVGSPYLEDDWLRGTILLYETEDRIVNYPLRYNLYANVFEIKVNNEIKGLEGSRVKEFTLSADGQSSRTFLNGKKWSLGNDAGFLELMADGHMKLLKKIELIIKQPDYSVQFNVGSRDTRILKEESMFYSIQDNIAEFPRKEKKILTLFGDKREAALEYIKSNDLSITTEEGAAEIVSFYNSISEK
jgi:hypothetical protein